MNNVRARITSVKADGNGAHINFVIEQTDVPRSRLGRFLFRSPVKTETLKNESLYCSNMSEVEKRIRDRMHGFIKEYFQPDAEVNHLVGQVYEATVVTKP